MDPDSLALHRSQVIGTTACTGCMLGWVAIVQDVSPVFRYLVAFPMAEVLGLISLPALAIVCLWWGSAAAGKRLQPLQQKRLNEKQEIVNEQALLKIEALEGKIKTLETALSKALQKS